MFLRVLRLVWVFVLAGSYLSWVVKLLCFKASLHVGAVTSNIFLLEDSWLMRLLIDLGGSCITEGGWLDELLMYRGSSFGFLWGL